MEYHRNVGNKGFLPKPRVSARYERYAHEACLYSFERPSQARCSKRMPKRGLVLPRPSILGLTRGTFLKARLQQPIFRAVKAKKTPSKDNNNAFGPVAT